MINFKHIDQFNWEEEKPVAVGGVYAHSDAEGYVADAINYGVAGHFPSAPDLIGTTDEMPTEDGIYPVKLLDKDAMLYFWVVKECFGGDRMRGLVCLTTDIEGCNNAKKKFDERRQTI